MDTPLPPEFAPEPGWNHLDLPRKFGKGRSFVSGDLEDDRLRIYYYNREADNALCAKVWFGIGAEGPPGHAHGGSMAAVLDEAMGFTCWVNNHPVVAAELNIKFRQKLPLDKVLHVESTIAQVKGRKIKTEGRIFNPETDETYASGTGLFIVLTVNEFGEHTLSDMLEENTKE